MAAPPAGALLLPLLLSVLLAPSHAAPLTSLTSHLPNWYATATSTQPELRHQLSAVGTTTTNSNRRMAQCMVTRDDFLGPYFLPGAPNRTQNFCRRANGSKAGSWKALTVTINLFDGCSGKAITNRTGSIQVWQANNHGEYDNAVSPSGQCNSCGCRARLPLINKDNRTSQRIATYSTIMPVPYGDQDCYRPAHIHHIFDVVGYQQLTTQMYFKGEKYLGANDCGCQSACHSGDRSLQVTVDSSGRSRWDVYLLPLAAPSKRRRHQQQ